MDRHREEYAERERQRKAAEEKGTPSTLRQRDECIRRALLLRLCAGHVRLTMREERLPVPNSDPAQFAHHVCHLIIIIIIIIPTITVLFV